MFLVGNPITEIILLAWGEAFSSVLESTTRDAVLDGLPALRLTIFNFLKG